MSSVLRIVVGGMVGAAFGLAMYKFVGCRTGACPLTANPFIATVLWGVIGALIGAGR